MKTRILAALVVVAATAALSGCASGGTFGDRAGIISVNGSEPVAPLIPAQTDEVGGDRIISALFAGLMWSDATGTATEDLAQSIDHSADNRVYTVTLKKGQTFTNGEAITSASFTTAWDWAAQFSNATADRMAFASILGFDAEKDASLVDGKGLVVVDDQTFEIHLKVAEPDFTLRLSDPAFSPMPTVFYDDPAAFGANPVGNGPYMLDGADAWQHGEKIDLVVNPSYHGARTPLNKGITMRFYASSATAYADLLSGNLDVLDTIPDAAFPTFSDDLDGRAITQPLATLDSLQIPLKLAHLAGQEGLLRREALSLAIDRDALVASDLGGRGAAAQDFSSPAAHGFSTALAGADVLTFRKDVATERWAQADAVSPWEGTFEIAYVEGADDDWAIALADQIHTVLGIDTKAVPYANEADLTMAITTGTLASAYAVHWKAGYPGVREFLEPFYAPKAAQNGTIYVDTSVTALFLKASKEKTLDEANTDYLNIQNILLADMPGIPLFNDTVSVGFDDTVKHVALDWRGIPQYFEIASTEG